MGPQLDVAVRTPISLPPVAAGNLPHEPQAGAAPAGLADAVREMAAGDKVALARLYDATAGRVFAVAMRILGDAATAEEVALDVYLQAWRSAAGYDPARASVLTWLLMICRSRALDALRARHEPCSDADLNELSVSDSGAGDPLLHCEGQQRRAALGRSLAALFPIERQLVALAFYRGLSHAEMAAHTGIPLGTVKTHMRRALAKLRRAIEGKSGEVP